MSGAMIGQVNIWDGAIIEVIRHEHGIQLKILGPLRGRKASCWLSPSKALKLSELLAEAARDD